MSSRKLIDLHPDLLPLANDFLKKCKNMGLNITVTCTYRSSLEQDILFTYGRTVPNPNNKTHPWRTATNAKGGQSEHNFTLSGNPASKAFDIVPIVNGIADWTPDFKANDPWIKIAAAWRSMQPINGFYLDWYGRKGAPYLEYAHFCLKKV